MYPPLLILHIPDPQYLKKIPSVPKQQKSNKTVKMAIPLGELEKAPAAFVHSRRSTRVSNVSPDQQAKSSKRPATEAPASETSAASKRRTIAPICDTAPKSECRTNVAVSDTPAKRTRSKTLAVDAPKSRRRN
jgi:hypothetical protein